MTPRAIFHIRDLFVLRTGEASEKEFASNGTVENCRPLFNFNSGEWRHISVILQR